MHSTLIVARMEPGSSGEVARIFERFDRTEMPQIMGTRRRQLFSYQGLYFHLQDFNSDGSAAIEQVRSHPLFVGVSADLKQHISPYDPETWRSPADAMATRFYYWQLSV
jgi:cyclase